MATTKLSKADKAYELFFSVMMYVNYMTPDNGAYESLAPILEQLGGKTDASCSGALASW